MHATTEAEFTAPDTAGILVDRFTLLWGCPVPLLSDIGLQFYSQLSHAIYERLGFNKIPASAYCTTHAPTVVLNHKMALMLARVVHEQQTAWTDELLTGSGSIRRCNALIL